jgi:acetyltransferase
MLDALFRPKSVAVIGASAKELNVGNRIVKNLVEFGFKGNIYPINPKVTEIRGLKAYPSILDVPTEVDVVHLPIPAVSVPQAIEECGQRGTRVAILNGGGFSEAGPAGAAIEEECIAKAKSHSIRIFGPNCQGIINTDPDIRAYCNFTFTKPDPGAISIVALSGGVAELIHQTLFELGAGTRMYASNGNACDISIPEIIKYYGEDEGTKVIVLYVEGLKDPDKFLQVATEVARRKPILAMKAGRTSDGAKAAASHTGGLAREEMTTDLIFDKAGILAFRDEAELCRAAAVFAQQPIPRGRRVGVITNTGGPSVIATDALVTGGLTVPALSSKTEAELKTKLLPETTVRNPLDVLATANAGHFRAALDAMTDDEGIDSIFINFVTPFFVDCESIAQEIAAVSGLGKKPIVCNLMTDKKERIETIRILKEGGVPCFGFPSSAAEALASLGRYAAIRQREEGKVESFADIDRAGARAVIDKAVREGRNMLLSDEVYTVLSAYGVPVADWSIARTPEEAKEQAVRMGFPVVLKADSTKITHKTDAGGVALDLRDAESVQAAAEKIRKSVSDPGLRFLVQKHVPGGREIIIGAKATGDGLGHVVMCGLGGIHAEVLKDVAFKLSPVTDRETTEMLAALRAAPLLKGLRNEAAADLAGVAEVVQRVSRMVADLPAIREMDINPLLAFEKDVCAVDGRIIL